jgi:hypothetical protein
LIDCYVAQTCQSAGWYTTIRAMFNDRVCALHEQQYTIPHVQDIPIIIGTEKCKFNLTP